MPGPVSDSYDPEFGTGANADDVREAIADVERHITESIGVELKDIVDVVHGPRGDGVALLLTERQMRVIRFCLRRALETV